VSSLFFFLSLAVDSTSTPQEDYSKTKKHGVLPRSFVFSPAIKYPSNTLLYCFSMSSYTRHHCIENELYMIKSHHARSDSDSDRSEASHRSGSTAPTEYEYCTQASELTTHHTVEVMPEEDSEEEEEDKGDVYDRTHASSTCSVDTYSSSVPSLHEPDDHALDFKVLPVYRPRTFYSDDIPSTPADFAELFPSTRRLTVAHDDTSLDGNMNLKVNTLIKTSHGRMQYMTLFHLRLYDHKNRQFSFRRYCRNSGREVCHTARRHAESAEERRPSLQQSLSNAFAVFRTKSESTIPTMKRADAGCESSQPEIDASDVQPRRPQSSSGLFKTNTRTPTNTIKLDFSNYAQVEMKRRGTQSNKRYDFQYWGRGYQWRMSTQKDGLGTQKSFQLYRSNGDIALAHIVPEPQDSAEREEERMKGGWIPTCSMWISDERVWQSQNDVSDVVMATGLVALVDESIRQYFQSKQQKTRQSLPMSNSLFDMDRIPGAKRMFRGTSSRLVY